MISFARGVPAPECLPVEVLADCARAAVERDGKMILNYGPVAGYGEPAGPQDLLSGQAGDPPAADDDTWPSSGQW